LISPRRFEKRGRGGKSWERTDHRRHLRVLFCQSTTEVWGTKNSRTAGENPKIANG